MSQKKHVSVVILSYNRQDIILNCLQLLSRIQKGDYILDLIVVDNGSTDKTVKLIKDKFPKIILLKNKRNYGYAKGINLGIKYAYTNGADYIMLLNNDVEFKPDFFKKFIGKVITRKIPIAGPLIKTKNNYIWSMGGRIDPARFSGGLIANGMKNVKKGNIRPVDFISGTAILVHRDVFTKIGFLDEDYYLYYDDVDFCYRAKKEGFKSYLIPQAGLVHLESLTIKKGSAAHYYHPALSHLIFVYKQAPWSIKIREIIRLFKTVFELLYEHNPKRKNYELLAIRDFFLGRIGQKTIVKP